MDDLKISHKDKKAADNILKILERKYGRMSVTRGKKHTYVGMNVEYCNDRSAEISMKDCLPEAIEQFPEDITSSRSTPTTLYFFDVNESSVDLPKKDSEILQKITAKLLLVCPRGQSDLQVATSLLTTRFTCPHVGDWNKLKRVL